MFGRVPPLSRLERLLTPVSDWEDDTLSRMWGDISARGEPEDEVFEFGLVIQ